ncbi:MAG: translation initiation factor IF-2 [Candidatus Undinarchaeales archaeon]
MIRQPIVSILGHIDHGKTTLLDKVRGTVITAKEAGGITQHIGATEVPIDAVKEICGPLLDNLKTDITIPGLLFIDTPGHAAFTNLRKRGGSISDIGILIVDINEGFKLQTYEALKILQTYKTPFIVVANKIDLIPKWKSNPDKPLLKSINEQKNDVQENLDMNIYSLVRELHQKGFASERFDRVKDFTNEIAVVPLSAETGEGVPEFLMVLAGMAQRYLEDKLKINVKGPGKGAILEVKKTEGLGHTIDVILYDGKIKKTDKIVFGTANKPLDTNVKALLKPKPMKEIRIGSRFDNVDEVYAAAGLKIAAPGLKDALSGSPVLVAKNDEDVEKLKQDIKDQIKSAQVETDKKGVIVKADTLGSLEALVKMLQDEQIPVKKASFGDVSKKDLADAKAVKEDDRMHGVVFAFNVNVPSAVDKASEDMGINVFQGEVVYSLIDNYKEWVENERSQTIEQVMKKVILPAKVKLLKGYVFRQSKPAIAGFEIQEGIIKPDCDLINKSGERVGHLKQIQEEGDPVSEATAGKQVALSISGAIIGKNIEEGDELYVNVPKKDILLIKDKLSKKLSESEMKLLDEIRKLKKRK